MDRSYDETKSADLYVLLNLPRSATEPQVSAAFKRLSRTFHPDKATPPSRDQAESTFIAARQASDILSNEVLRAAYDCGGMLAVELVRRSQAHSTATLEDELEPSQFDLYTALKQAASKEEQIEIVREAVESYKAHQKEVSSPQFEATSQVPQRYMAVDGLLQRDSTAMQLQTRRRIGNWNISLGASSNVRRTAETDIGSSFGLNYQPVRGSTWSADAMLNHRDAAPQVSVRTTRQLSSGSFVVLSLAGKANALKSWTYSLMSYRNILYKGRTKSSQSDLKLQASWRVGISPKGALQFLMATIKTLEFPQWKGRLGLAAYPVKVSYQAAERNSLYVAVSRGWLWSRAKMVWIEELNNRWTLKCGLKYDGKAAFTGGSLWTVLCQLESSEWTLRFPIGLYQDSGWITNCLIAGLAGQWIGHQLDGWVARTGSRGSDLAASEVASSRTVPFHDVVKRVARKKREMEADKGGLVILKAVWRDKSGEIQVTDMLQFWVVDSSLHLPLHECRWWRNTESPKVDKWPWNWWSLLWQNEGDHERSKEGSGSLVVRYRLANNVYDIWFEGDELVWLPNRLATKLGSVETVQ